LAEEHERDKKHPDRIELPDSLLAHWVMRYVRIAHGRQFTSVFAGLSVLVRAVGYDLRVLVGKQLRCEFLNFT
jgi:hypothetical protein